MRNQTRCQCDLVKLREELEEDTIRVTNVMPALSQQTLPETLTAILSTRY